MHEDRERHTQQPATDERAGNLFGTVSGWCCRRPWLTIVTWVIVIIVAGYFSAAFTRNLTGSTNEVYGSEASAVEQALRAKFPSLGSETDFFVLSSRSGPVDGLAGREAVRRLREAARQRPEVVSTASPFEEHSMPLLSGDRSTALVPVMVEGEQGALQNMTPAMQELANSARSADLDIWYTGSAPLALANVQQSDQDVARAESMGLPAALIILLLAFGSVVAAGLPLGLGMLGVVTALGALGMASSVIEFDSLTQTAVSMVGLALGIDYSLFLVTRFREELAVTRGQQLPRWVPVVRTSETAGRAVALSGGTVFVALAGLMVVRAPIVRTMTLGVMATVLMMVLLTLTLLPAVLVLLGERVNRLALPWARSALRNPDPEHSRWARWTGFVMGRPLLLGGLVVLLLSALALPLFGLRYGVDHGMNALSVSDPGKGYEAIREKFEPGTVTPLEITVKARGGSFGREELEELAGFETRLTHDQRVAHVVGLGTMLDKGAGGHSPAHLGKAEQAAPDRVRQLLSEDRGTAVVRAFPVQAADTAEVSDLVRDLRQQQARDLRALEVKVGGAPGEIVDMTDENSRATPLVIAGILTASFVLLLIAFRSVLIAAKAVLMNVLSVGAAFGLLILVFQEGHGADLLNVHRTGFIQVIIPLLVFALVFGLSMDYEVFMISRMKEEWDQHADNSRAVRAGITHTAKVISAAAAIMIVVFGAFTFTEVLEIKQMGFAMAVAVLLDATVVRLLLVPAFMQLMGRWNWWMPRLGRARRSR